MADRLRRRTQCRAQSCWHRIRRHRSRVHRLLGAGRVGRSGQTHARPPLHAHGHVHLPAARHRRDGRLRRRRVPPHTAHHARTRTDGITPRLQHRRHRERPLAGDHLDRSRPSSHHLSQGTRAARRRRSAHSFAHGRPRAESGTGRRDEPRVEARGDRPGRRATRPARHLHDRTSSGRRAGARLVARANRHHAAGPKLPRARSHPPRRPRHPRWRDLLCRTRMGSMPAL